MLSRQPQARQDWTEQVLDQSSWTRVSVTQRYLQTSEETGQILCRKDTRVIISHTQKFGIIVVLYPLTLTTQGLSIFAKHPGSCVKLLWLELYVNGR